MAKRPMGIIDRIRKHLGEGYEVILKKESDGAHPVSYSRVTGIEGTHLRRTMFEAESVAETYDYKPGKYSTDGVEHNERICYYGLGKRKPVAPPSKDAYINDDEDNELYYDEFDEDIEDEDTECACCRLSEPIRISRAHQELKTIRL